MKRFVENLYTLQNLETTARKSNAEQVEALRKGLPADMLARFDRLRKRGKKGVALVRNGVCTGCHLRVATGVYNSVVLGASAITCGNCGSYLYLPAEETPSEESKTKGVPAAA